MIYVIIILALFLVVFAMLAIKREYNFKISAKLEIEEIQSNVTNLAISLRMPNMNGTAPRARSVLSKLKKSYKLICNKVTNNEDLYEYERWLYENYYSAISSITSSKYNYFALLPSISGKARVLILADFIVSSNDHELTKEHLTEIINNFNLYTPLDKDEIFSLPDAIKFVCIQRISNICMKSKEYRNAKKAANIEKFNIKKQHLDSYMYWRSRLGYINNDKSKAQEYDGNIDNIEYSFSKILVEQGRTTAKCINTLLYIDDNLSLDYIVNLSYTNQLMSADSTYMSMDINSKAAYLNSIEILSIKYKIEEQSIVKQAFELAAINNIHFGYYLFEGRRQLKKYIRSSELPESNSKSTKGVQYLFITAVFAINIIASIAFSIFGAVKLWSIITFAFAIFFAALPITEYLAIYFFKLFLVKKPTPKLDNQTVNTDGKTIVVMPCFVCDEIEGEKVANAIIRIREGNHMQNVEFALLIDYPSSKSSKHEKFNDFTNSITNKINKYSDINLFIRKPVKLGDKYIAHEKKRGALMDFTDALIRVNYSAFEFVLNENISSPKFIITLDSDNELTPGTVLSAINTMLHPINSSYDLMTFNAKYNLYSMNTLFSKQYYYDSGYDRYSNEDSFYYNLTSKGLFNGKGIFRLNEFYTKLYNVLPSGKVLSHDIIEGSLLNTGVLNERVYEDAPNSLFSEITRKNRWLRGDLLLAGFVKNKIKNDNDSVTTIKKEPIYKHVMVSNIIKSITPIALLLLLIIPLVYSSILMAIPFLAAFVLEYIIRIFGALNGTVNGVRARYVVRYIAEIIFEMLIKFIILPFLAINNLMVIVELIFTSIFKPENKLNWTPFSATQKSNSVLSYLSLILPSVIFATIISAIMYNNIFILAYFSIFIAIIIGLYVSGGLSEKEQFVKNEDSNFLINIAEKTYKFFNECTVNDLITDNYQSKPYKGNAISTSPTNIGFSLLAEISAYELGIINIETANEKITAKLKAVSSLRKYKGHLYNWYNVETKQILSPNVISSVDSGNFLASLITLKQFIKKHNLDNVDIVENMINATDLDFLYDKNHRQFYISYNTNDRLFNGHYDMLASEARTLYYIYSSISHNTAGWMSLKRQMSRLKGNTLMSWSGTMFEYLMPRIFMKTPQNSLLEDSEKNIVEIAKANKCQGVFGISESGHYQFDNNLNYQYYAFGLNEVAVRNSRNSCVISPYSTFLCLPINAGSAIDNLTILKNEDMIGEYGYYEAVDFTTKKNIIYSYMSHHQGMIITSIANMLRNECISSYFQSDSKIQGARTLLCERRTLTKSQKIAKTDFVYNVDKGEKLICSESDLLGILTNGAYSYFALDSGQNTSIVNGNVIGKMRMYNAKSGLCNFVSNEKDLVTLSYRQCDNLLSGNEFSHTFTDVCCKFTNNSANICEQVYIPNCIKGEVHKFTISNNSSDILDKNCHGYMDISICPYIDEISHTAFSDMFKSSEKIDDNTIIFHQKSRTESGDKYVAIKLYGLDDVILETNKRNSIDTYTKEHKWNKEEYIDSFGDVVTPCFSYNGIAKVNKMSTKTYYLSIIYSDTINELLTEIAVLDSENAFEYLIESAKVKSISVSNNLFEKNSDYCMTLSLAKIITCGSYSNSALLAIAKEDYSNLISALKCPHDCKIIYYNYHDNPNILDAVSKAISYMKDIPTTHKFVIYYDKSNKNVGEIESRISKEFNCNNGNYIIINDSYLANNVREIALYKIENKDGKYMDNSDTIKNEILDSSDPTAKPEILFNVKHGGFTSDSYLIDSRTSKPYSNVICGEFGGTVLTTQGSCFTYFGNSRNNKVSEWSNNQFEDNSSEKLMINMNEISWQINKLYNNGTVCHKLGSTVYNCNNLDIISEVNVSILSDGKSKLYEISLINNNNITQKMEIALDSRYALGVNYEPKGILIKTNNEICEIFNVYTKQKVYQRFIGFLAKTKQNAHSITNYIDISLLANQKLNIYLVMSCDNDIICNYNQGNIISERNKMITYFNQLNKISVNTSSKSFDILFNKSLMYQTVSARLNGKCGFYQVGGAIGFRDQLQDCLAYLYSNPEYVRTHIIESAKRQFIDGDVLHWWHNPNIGVRTKISDDKLFLPYVVSEYIRITGDRSILSEKASYLTGKNLEKGVHDAYMAYNEGDVIESIYSHCIRAIDNSLKYGINDILLIGSGDWNDALNNIGDEKSGESVWLSMFCYHVITKFSKYMDADIKDKLSHDKVRLKRGIRGAYKNGWYARAFTKDGEWLGTSSTTVCNIDLICQSFAMISGACPDKMARKAMENAEQLIDKEKGLIKLLSPPFDHSKNYGYISHYPSGVRENGGQYTHAVAWYIKALAMIDRVKAYDMLELINPINKAINNPKYDVEPYVMSADVYTSGVGGWTWYTGSSAWMYKIIIEDILGIEFDENILRIKPKYIPKLGDIKLNIIKGDININITIFKSSENNIKINNVINTQTSNYEIVLEGNRKIYDININLTP